MNSERELLYFKMELLQAEIEMNGMIAENKIRESNGDALAYDEKSFLSLIEKHGIHHNQFPFYRENNYETTYYNRPIS